MTEDGRQKTDEVISSQLSVPPEGEEMERRSFEVQELRISGDDEDNEKIEGYAAVFDQLSEEMWGFREKISPGAFEGTIGEDDIRALWNHDPNYPLGRNRAGTLELEEDDKGLRVQILPPETSYASDLVESIREFAALAGFAVVEGK